MECAASPRVSAHSPQPVQSTERLRVQVWILGRVETVWGLGEG